MIGDGPCAGGDHTCGRCGYPARRPPTPPEQKIKIQLDEYTRPIWESAKRAAEKVASWPAWKANECRCTDAELSAFMASILRGDDTEDPAEDEAAAIRYLAAFHMTTPQTISDAIDKFRNAIASAFAVPAHLLDPNAPAPVTALVHVPSTPEPSAELVHPYTGRGYRGAVFVPDCDGGVVPTRIHCDAISSIDAYGDVPLEDTPEDFRALHKPSERATCYSCRGPLGFIASAPPALCADCENVP